MAIFTGILPLLFVLVVGTSAIPTKTSSEQDVNRTISAVTPDPEYPSQSEYDYHPGDVYYEFKEDGTVEVDQIGSGNSGNLEPREAAFTGETDVIDPDAEIFTTDQLYPVDLTDLLELENLRVRYLDLEPKGRRRFKRSYANDPESSDDDSRDHSTYAYQKAVLPNHEYYRVAKKLRSHDRRKPHGRTNDRYMKQQPEQPRQHYLPDGFLEVWSKMLTGLWLGELGGRVTQTFTQSLKSTRDFLGL